MAHLGPTLRRTRRREHPAWRVVAAVLVSLGVNALVLTRLDASWLHIGTGPVRDVELEPLTAEAWAANRALRASPLRPVPAPVPPPQVEVPGQVVEVAPSADSTRPKDTPFVSDRNNTVAKETRARVARAGQPRTLPSLAEAGAAGRPRPPPGEDGRDGRSRPGRLGNPGGEERRVGRLAMADRTPPAPEPPGGELPGAPTVAPAPPATPGAEAVGTGGEGGALRLGRYDPRLSVPAETLARIAGGPAPDYLKDVEEGDGTYLNTREWKYATYFNRIKQAVATAWDGKPQRALDLRDPDRTMYAYRDRFTLLAVTLDDGGQVKDLRVTQSSGVDFLDRTALDAFRTAQPFVNPPRGVVDEHGEIRFTFGFYLAVDRAGFSIQRRP